MKRFIQIWILAAATLNLGGLATAQDLGYAASSNQQMQPTTIPVPVQISNPFASGPISLPIPDAGIPDAIIL
jgi:hypothetical protein